MTVIDKPHLDRAHVLDLLAHMIRIRNFEDKCAELYTQQKIRGFLHLYDGEEAIAAGVIPVLAIATASSPPTANTVRRWCAACR
jgi:2-oxoisovalerate dehydrogenase E1 component